MSIKNTLTNLGRKVSKHSPTILTTVGIVGLGATAYLAYKSRDKVEAVVIELEEKRDAGQVVNKFDVARDLAEAVSLPVTVGVLSCASILMAHKIQNKRIASLAGALAAQQAQNIWFEHKYRKEHGDEAYAKFIVPTDEVQVEGVDGKGKPKTTVEKVKKDIDHSIGQWFQDSCEYASDDHTYNVAFIDSVNERMQTLLFQRGTLLLNEVREALGFERIRSGALLGWTTADNFDLMKSVVNDINVGEGEIQEQIWVTWTRPRYIYEDVEFNGRYSII